MQTLPTAINKGISALILALLISVAPITSASATGEEECSGNWDGGVCDPDYDPNPPTAPAPTPPLSLAASTVTVTEQGDEMCEELNAINDDREPEACATQETLAVDAAAEVTDTQLSTDGSLTSSRGVTLSAAAAKGSKIYYKPWTQSMRGLYYVNWKEEHRGGVYFDGNNVWIKANRGYTGFHRCGFNSGIGYSISITDCSENFKPNSNGTLALQQWDVFKVHVVAKGIPIYKTHSMHVNAYKTGTVTFY